MKRGFVYGIGTYFMAAAIWMPTEPANRYHLIRLDELAVAFELGLVVAAIIAFYAATFFPPRRSWWHTPIGGVLGFFATMAAMLVLLAVLAGWDALSSSRPVQRTPPCSPGLGLDCR
jgi:hypothetical protein